MWLFLFEHGDGRKLRKRYDIDKKELVVSYIGRVEDEKGVKRLLQLSSITGIRLMFVGGGSKLEELKERARGSSIIFTDKVDYKEIADYFAASDLVVTASKSETQCLTIWEAHAAGKPVIAIDSVGVKDYINNGKDGFLVKSIKEMKEKIQDLNKNRKRLNNLSKGALRVTKERKKYDSTKKLLEIYRSLIKN